MKDKKWVFQTLGIILDFYDNERVILKKSKEEAKKKVLEIYSDFYEVLTGEKQL
jgi:hypothetical protein